MSLRNSLLILILFTAVNTAIAQEQHRPAGEIHELDLNHFAGNAEGKHKKVRLERGTMHFILRDSASASYSDSMYLLTRFPAPSDKPFRLAAIESRIDDFDTSQLELHFVVLQLHNGDTVFREFPVLPDAGTKSSKHWTRLRFQETDVTLQAAHFYLGYAYRQKKGVKEVTYHSYAASAGGEGAFFSIMKGSWKLTRSQFYQILPFRISYVEL
jgi:hypothetical protein